MTPPVTTEERRREIRLDCDDVIRWKRPGRIEDKKGWSVDRSPSGIGFMTRADEAPTIGDEIHIRRFDRDCWATLEDSIRVARTDAVNDELVVIGCIVD